MLVANARMYTLERATGAAWRKLLEWVAYVAGVPMRYELHAAPAPLDALWRRPDLGCALMCGYPFATWHDASVASPGAACRGGAAQRRAGRTLAVPYRARRRRPQRHRAARRSAGAAPGVHDARFAERLPGRTRVGCRARARHAGGRWFGATVGPLVTPRARRRGGARWRGRRRAAGRLLARVAAPPRARDRAAAACRRIHRVDADAAVRVQRHAGAGDPYAPRHRAGRRGPHVGPRAGTRHVGAGRHRTRRRGRTTRSWPRVRAPRTTSAILCCNDPDRSPPCCASLFVLSRPVRRRAGPRAGHVSGPRAAHHRAVPAGRARRRAGAHRGRAAHAVARPGGRGGEQARRGGQHRHGARRQGGRPTATRSRWRRSAISRCRRTSIRSCPTIR